MVLNGGGSFLRNGFDSLDKLLLENDILLLVGECNESEEEHCNYKNFHDD
jgi:hypothetical protein